MPEKVVDKETKRLRKDLEEKIVKRKNGKKEMQDDLLVKKVSSKKQKYKINLLDDFEEEYDDLEMHI